MPILVFAMTSINPDNPEALATYLGVTGPMLDDAGAKIIQCYEVTETIVGKPLPKIITLVEYPDRAAVDRVFQSTEYQWLRDIREKAFLEYRINIVEG